MAHVFLLGFEIVGVVGVRSDHDRHVFNDAHPVSFEPGTFLGSLERTTLDHTLQMYLNRLDLEIEKIREGLAAKMRIGRCLGVMSGIFLIVILI